MRDEDQPPPGAVLLSEALNPQLLDALRQAEERLAAAQAAVPPQPSWFGRSWGGRFDEALEAWKHSPAVRAAAAAQDEVNRAWRAAADDRQARLINGELLAWGREDNPWGRWRAIPPDAWNTLVVINEKGGIVRGPTSAAAHLYGVIVAPTQRQELGTSALASTIAAEDRCRKWLIEEMVSGARQGNTHNNIQSVPPAPTNEQTTTIRQFQSTRYPPEKVKAWYLRWVASCKQEGSIPSREDDLRAAKAEFPNINREQVRDARREFAPDDWHNRGPRRKAK